VARVFKISGVCTVISRILLSAYQLIRVEQMAVGTSAYHIDRLYHHQFISLHLISTSLPLFTHRRVKVDKDGAWDVFAFASLGEKCLIRATLVNFLDIIRLDVTIGQKIMLEQIATSSINSESLQNESQENKDLQLPGSIAKLGTSLA
jgi:hypothetical protein